MIRWIRNILYHYLVVFPVGALMLCLELWDDLRSGIDPSKSEDGSECPEETEDSGMWLSMTESAARRMSAEDIEALDKRGWMICMLPDDVAKGNGETDPH